MRCEYPAYGEGCSRVCKCPMKLCDLALGCEVSIQTGEVFEDILKLFSSFINLHILQNLQTLLQIHT